jgi:hypothetical protein
MLLLKKKHLNNSFFVVNKLSNNAYISMYLFFNELNFYKLISDPYTHNVWKELKIPYIKALKVFQLKYNLILLLCIFFFLFLFIKLTEQLITYGKNKKKLITVKNNINFLKTTNWYLEYNIFFYFFNIKKKLYFTFFIKRDFLKNIHKKKYSLIKNNNYLFFLINNRKKYNYYLYLKNNIYYYYYNYYFFLSYYKYNFFKYSIFSIKKFIFKNPQLLLPQKKIKKYIVLRSPHIYKKFFDQFGQISYKYFIINTFKLFTYNLININILKKFLIFNYLLNPFNNNQYYLKIILTYTMNKNDISVK